MTTGLWVALAAIAVALLFGAYRARTDGRFRSRTESAAGTTPDSADEPTSAAASVVEPTSAAASVVEPTSAASRVETTPPTTWTQLADTAQGIQLGERATLVQFSSAFCAPCRVTRQVLSDVAGQVPGVMHVEIDAELHLDTVRRLDILRTPTTLILDADGREIARAAGAPRKEQVLSALP